MWRAATLGGGAAEVVSTGSVGVGVLEAVETKLLERSAMKRYLKFAAGFWVSAFLVAGSMATAQQSTPTPPATAKTKKNSGSTTTAPAPADTSNSSQTQ